MVRVRVPYYPMFLHFDQSGRPILPPPRPCDRKSEHESLEETLRCPACNPCFCQTGAAGSLYECTRCVRYTLGGAKKARELGIETGFCDHNRWKRASCTDCKKVAAAQCKQASGTDGKKVAAAQCKQANGTDAKKVAVDRCKRANGIDAKKVAVDRCEHDLPLAYSCRACRSKGRLAADEEWPGSGVYFLLQEAEQADRARFGMPRGTRTSPPKKSPRYD